jgi:predicted phage terminase large subunit-like protein
LIQSDFLSDCLLEDKFAIIWINMKKTGKHLYKTTPAAFAKEISQGRWKAARHLKCLNSLLLKLTDRKIKRLIVNMPPRHGKSEFISKYFPVWYLCNFPDERIILTSYNHMMAKSFGRNVRDLIAEHGKKHYDLQLNPSQKAADSFSLKGHWGGMDTTGVGGTITGKAANLLIIDDPIKNDEQAGSRYLREKIWDWFISTAYTRLEPDGIIVLVMTRWHEDDMAGRILKMDKKKGKWVHLNLRAIAEDNCELGRKNSHALWPARYNKKALEEIKETIGSYWFSSLYQQRPVPRGSSIFKRKNFLFFEEDNELYSLKQRYGDEKKIGKNHCRRFAVIDLAATVKETSDYTVILIFSITPENEILIEEVIRERFKGSEHLNLVKEVYEDFKPILIGIESNQYQISLVQSSMAAGLPVKELRADRDKISRALPIAAKIEAGMVYFKKECHWLGNFEEELLSFPNGKHDDQVDALAYITKIAEPISGLLPTGCGRKKTRGLTRRFK